MPSKCGVKPLPDGALELQEQYDKTATPERFIIVDPQKGWTVREHRVFASDGKTLLYRSVADLQMVPDTTVWFPTSVEVWQYHRPKAGQAASLSYHTQTTFSKVVVGQAKASDCTLAALHVPDAWGVARTGVDGKIATLYAHDDQLLDWDQAHKAGVEQKSRAVMYHIHPTTAKTH